MHTKLENKKVILNKFIEKKGINGLLFSKIENLSWLLSPFVDLDFNALRNSNAVIVYSLENGLELITTEIELKTIFSSIVESNLITTKAFDWFNTNKQKEFISECFSDKEFYSDSAIYGNYNNDVEFENISMQMSDSEVESYVALGKDMAMVMDIVSSSIQSGISDTEFDLSVIASSFLVNNKIRPCEVLFASDNRIEEFAYPAATDKTVERIIKIRLLGERLGQFCSLTRYISFGNVTLEQEASFNVSLLLRASIQHNTITGIKLNEIFEAAKVVYQKLNHESEINNHQLGGITGYKEVYDSSWTDVTKELEINTAISWASGIKGFECEDSFVLTSDGLKQVTNTESWPKKIIEIAGEKITISSLLIKEI